LKTPEAAAELRARQGDALTIRRCEWLRAVILSRREIVWAWDYARSFVHAVERLEHYLRRDSYNREAAVAARTLGITIHHFRMRHAEEFPAVFRHMVDKGDRGLLVYTTPFTYAHRRQIVELAAQHRIAVCYGGKGWVEAGGLMSYGPSGLAIVRRTAVYVDKILKGAWPGDLPIEQPTKFELVINLKTAKALGLTIPRLLILRADEVIE